MVRSAAALAAVLVATPAFAEGGCPEFPASVLRSGITAPLPAYLMEVADSVVDSRLVTLRTEAVEQVADTRGETGTKLDGQ
ncbi:hypothetical protein [Arenibaculum pallidiluteum]|uniref:hypothetical protein n=1 Tax=Arenibaculum pallidiluteum TaxID=2812559 RepID=UPI001A9771FD|nr:hypothetical protein [Arenibaculum pallidiluteum]